MSFLKGADQQVDQVIDKATKVAKICAMIGGKIKAGDAKEPKKERGIGDLVSDMVSGADPKKAAEAAAALAMRLAKGQLK